MRLISTLLHGLLAPALAVVLASSVATLVAGPPAAQRPEKAELLGPMDITVLVLQDDGNPSTPLTPVNGAVVTLQGTDPLSHSGLTATTGASGRASFPGVTGPFSVTAQADYTVYGLTTRLATSLVAVQPSASGSPPSGTIGVPLFAEFEEPATVDAWLGGTVANLPALTGNEFVEVVAVANGPVEFEGSAMVDPSTGNYALPIPSNTPIDCFVAHREDPAFDKRTILASLLQPGVGQTGPGTTLVWNPDFASPAVVPWSSAVAFSATNVHPGLQLSIQLRVSDPANGIDYDFSFFDGLYSPSSITLPDVTDSNLAGYRIELSADSFDPQGNIEAGQDLDEILITTPTSAAFDFFSLPTILHPADFSTLTMAQFDALQVRVAEGSTGSFGDNGINLFSVATEAGAGGPPPPGIDQAWWVIITAAGVTGFDLPLYSRPMYGDTQSLYCAFEQVRFAGLALDYDVFFSGSLAANFAALDALTTATGDSFTGILLFLTP